MSGHTYVVRDGMHLEYVCPYCTFKWRLVARREFSAPALIEWEGTPLGPHVYRHVQRMQP